MSGIPRRGRRPFAAAALVLGLTGAARAQAPAIVQMPEGALPAPVVDKGVVCGPMAPGWSLEAGGQKVAPPRALPEGASRQFAVRVAASAGECASSNASVTLVATRRFPVLETGGVTFYPAEGRLTVRGKYLQGMQVVAPRGEGEEKDRRPQVESCVDAAKADTGKPDGEEVCTIAVPRTLRADADFQWLPADAAPEADPVLFDELGNRVRREALRLRPARVVLPARLWGKDGVDVSRGPGSVPLLYPEAIASVDCGAARCELDAGAVVVRAVPAPATSVTLTLRLAPRMYVPGEGTALVQSVSARLPLLSCPLQIVSGPVLREVSEPRLVARLDARCGADAGRFLWTVAGEPAQVERVLTEKNDVFVLLRSERITRDRVTVTAARGGIDGVVIGTTTESSVAAPVPRAMLELPGYGQIVFIPTNREATVQVGQAGEAGRFVLRSIEGVYRVGTLDGQVTVRGEETAGGFASLRFGYRVPALPGDLATVDLAVVYEPVQRQVRGASVPAPFAAKGDSAAPLAELVCADAAGKDVRVQPGRPHRIPLSARETCRVIIHRERLRPEDGFQEVVLEVDVRSAEGAPRPGAGTNERMVLRPGADPRVFWIRGGIDQFDTITVRLTHVVDEERYVISPTVRAGLPSVQWSAIVEGGRYRVYATAAIPAGLFRVNEPSGQLRLNFGVMSRVTYLNDVGREGLLGLELGLMGMGLVTSGGDIRDWPATLGLIVGLGFRMPLGQGAAVGIHGWAVYEFRDAYRLPGGGEASRLSFVFGPAISIGNVGKNL